MRHLPRCLLALGLSACAAPQTPSREPKPPAGSAPDSASATSTGASSAGNQPALDSKVAPHPLLDERSPDPQHALPRLGLKHIGLHVGGGNGSAEERSNLLDALEQKQVRLLQCYRLVDRPGVGGTFGTDLYVGAEGGHPEVRAMRHKLGGEGFESCMASALGSVTFGPQPRPLVVSYSLRFEMSL